MLVIPGAAGARAGNLVRAPPAGPTPVAFLARTCILNSILYGKLLPVYWIISGDTVCPVEVQVVPFVEYS